MATGIGITSILSAVLTYNKSRKVNIVWIVREEDMLTFFLDHLNINKGGWILVFYTGKSPLHAVLLEYYFESNIQIITKRPSLGNLIPNIVFGVDSGGIVFDDPCDDDDESSRQAKEVEKVLSRVPSVESFGKVTEKERRKHAWSELRSSGYQLTGILDVLSTLSQSEEAPTISKKEKTSFGRILKRSFHKNTTIEELMDDKKTSEDALEKSLRSGLRELSDRTFLVKILPHLQKMPMLALK